MTMLVTLVAKPAQTAASECEDLLEDTNNAPGHADADAQWPRKVAISLAKIIKGLTYSRGARNRMPLSTALSQLEALCTELSNEVPVGLVLPQEEQGDERDCVVCMVEARSVRFGCGHLVCCTGCADHLRAQQMSCPNCRAPIASASAAASAEPTFIGVGQPLSAVIEA